MGRSEVGVTLRLRSFSTFETKRNEKQRTDTSFLNVKYYEGYDILKSTLMSVPFEAKSLSQRRLTKKTLHITAVKQVSTALVVIRINTDEQTN
ncbi:hypothetical protein F2P81_012171 [Scophthalmus maximus]|uniref:Uncharacterized protein n=1 Tax=Scophthalmus maximus TaxID=52904 RepID=A0A6A4SJU7_SCOMX|nr:hypothetical protein F2P81_012171 [Scophthalmus maximus]